MDGLRMVDEWRTFDPDACRTRRCSALRTLRDLPRAGARRDARQRIDAQRLFELIDGQRPVRRVIDLSRSAASRARASSPRCAAPGRSEPLRERGPRRGPRASRRPRCRPPTRGSPPRCGAAVALLLLAAHARGAPTVPRAAQRSRWPARAPRATAAPAPPPRPSRLPTAAAPAASAARREGGATIPRWRDPAGRPYYSIQRRRRDPARPGTRGRRRHFRRTRPAPAAPWSSTTTGLPRAALYGDGEAPRIRSRARARHRRARARQRGPAGSRRASASGPARRCWSSCYGAAAPRRTLTRATSRRRCGW